ncbi:MAG: phycocyanin alpha phycocyanobilin lyase [Chloroflexota bacterium]|nr:MAG: phycocyanin alpha phycocyanobilin lyase [Chloroflexota bacterium]
MLFTQYLNEIADPKRPLKRSKLTFLSGLRPAEIETLAAAWSEIPIGRRQQIVQTMAELIEDNVELDFNEVFKKVGLRDEDQEVRRLSLVGLWECEDRDLIGPLVELLHGDEAEDVRAAAAEGLGRFILLGELKRLRPRDLERVLTALLESVDDPDESMQVHRRAVEAIGALNGEERVARVIEDSYQSPENEMKASALYAMGRNCDQRWLPNILAELDSSDPELRFEAVGACGQLEDERAVPKLVRLLADEDSQVRLGVVDALGHIGGDVAKQALRRCLQNPDEEMRQAAEDALEELAFSKDPLSFGLGD